MDAGRLVIRCAVDVTNLDTALDGLIKSLREFATDVRARLGNLELSAEFLFIAVASQHEAEKFKQVVDDTWTARLESELPTGARLQPVVSWMDQQSLNYPSDLARGHVATGLIADNQQIVDVHFLPDQFDF